MHFYPFNIGDYATATAHLEPLEDIAYRRLMDLYYSTEKPIPSCINKTSRLIRMRTHSECIEIILEEFFTLEDDGYHCNRIDVELFKFHEKSQKAKDSAKARWKKEKKKQSLKKPCGGNATALESHSEGNAKQYTGTSTQEPSLNPLAQPEVKPSKYKFDAYQMEFAEWMHSQLLILNPNFKKPNLESWANTLRLMLEVDKRDSVQVGEVFAWANKDPFWSSNILSPASLRKQYDALVVKMKQPQRKDKVVNDDSDNWERFDKETF